MNAPCAVGWGCWGQWGHTGGTRSGIAPHQDLVLGALWAWRRVAPVAPSLNPQKGQLKTSLLLTAPNVPTQLVHKRKISGCDQQTRNDSTYWS